ncbi:MAG: ribosomal protein S18-alanine N-acetyltransferase [Methylophilaceae bacterium]|uniref:ribosomal protein S18-alanine N-acetyltransferase n=1 Tax=Methylovorus sp. MM2 TaxID=1848038 RepID=UPI0007E1B139|nr:ribosomal protein S18-alanine N-acetyltransferase [Methylovorus sp. MM2]OAM51606.1 ribosomal-protein-alanine N-acetyltransferase [Methylovorus sp. MM2]
MNAEIQTSSISFRPMQMADLDAIMQIEPTIFPYPWSRGNFSDSLNAGYSCWIAEQRNVMIGYGVLMLVLDEAHLLNISIAAEYQGRGLGRELLVHMMQVARQYNALNMFLEVRVSNLAAIGLYENMGFNEMAIRRNYYPAKNGREDAILMGMAL